jgi:hypothetical protein
VSGAILPRPRDGEADALARYDATRIAEADLEVVAMSNSIAASFQQALEMVEGLPEEQQQDLVEIVRSRQRERHREALAASTEQARRELARGEVRRGTVDDLMAELAE